MAKYLDFVVWASEEAGGLCMCDFAFSVRQEKRGKERGLERRGRTTVPGKSAWDSAGVCDCRVGVVIAGLRSLGQSVVAIVWCV